MGNLINYKGEGIFEIFFGSTTRQSWGSGTVTEVRLPIFTSTRGLCKASLKTVDGTVLSSQIINYNQSFSFGSLVGATRKYLFFRTRKRDLRFISVINIGGNTANDMGLEISSLDLRAFPKLNIFIYSRLSPALRVLQSINLTNNKNLTLLEICNHILTNVDFSQCVELRNLRCFGNMLVSLDLSHNIHLTDLSCYSNNLTSLDFTNNINLINISAQANPLTSINVSTCISLISLNVNACLLTTLDVSNNTVLRVLAPYTNNLTSLNIVNNLLLTSLICNNNLNLTNIVFSISNYNDLAQVNLSFTKLDDISIQTFLNSLKFPSLTILSLGTITKSNDVDISGTNTSITNLDISNNFWNNGNTPTFLNKCLSITTLTLGSTAGGATSPLTSATFTINNQSITQLNISGCVNLSTSIPSLIFLINLKILNAILTYRTVARIDAFIKNFFNIVISNASLVIGNTKFRQINVDTTGNATGTTLALASRPTGIYQAPPGFVIGTLFTDDTRPALELLYVLVKNYKHAWSVKNLAGTGTDNLI